MGRTGKFWEIRDDYRRDLRKAKKLFPTILGHVRTSRVALVGFYCASSKVGARIYPNRRPYSLLLPDVDYLISIWSTRYDNEERYYRVFLMLHEAVHIPPEGHEEGSIGYRKIVEHDIEDFKFLREAYGLHLDNMKDVMKGEKHLLKERDEDAIQRFPRTVKIG
jgi:predicted metallopeptidase